MLGQVATILVTDQLLGVMLPLLPMLGVVLFLVGLNLVSLLRYRVQPEIGDTELFLELILDVAALTAQLYLSGGASNPFISLYLLQVILGAVLLRAAFTWLLVVMTGAAYLWLNFSFQPIAMPHPHGGDLFNMHMQGMFICFMLAAMLVALFVTRITRNLRERDAHLARLRQQSAEEALIVRMGLLASSAAHELGTPLGTLSVILGDWRKLPALRADPDIAEDIEEMQSQLDRCRSIVTNILLASGEARGEGTVRTTLSRFLDEAVGEWRASRAPLSVSYVNRVTPDPGIVSDLALKQILISLFDNALEASPGWVGITAERVADAVAITVHDVGPGFDAAILADLGVPYQSTRGRSGGGLGLFFAVNALRKLGGSVTARNNDGGGAAVTLALPLAALDIGERDAG